MAANMTVEEIDEQIKRLQERKREVIANERRERSELAAQAARVGGELLACCLPKDPYGLDLDALALWLVENEGALQAMCTKADEAIAERKRDISRVAKSPARALQSVRETSVDRGLAASAE